ncbi:MAG: GNAT family N-acetyltransferase [Lachnospiraceae bacterium]|nr:GNAT family N-acetyltransferase [Lachnospiraceae bacterium]
MVTVIRKVAPKEIDVLDNIADIHLQAFEGFFLTFMGKGFLKQMYRSYCEEQSSGLLAAEEDGNLVGFLAYSGDMSALYKYMIKKRVLIFAWFSLGAFLRKPAVFMRLLCAFLKPGESNRKETYMELASIGVSPAVKSKGIGTKLVEELKQMTDFGTYAYITLETDANNNEAVNKFYQKNGFRLEREFMTREGRRMNEYRYREGTEMELSVSSQQYQT